LVIKNNPFPDRHIKLSQIEFIDTPESYGLRWWEHGRGFGMGGSSFFGRLWWQHDSPRAFHTLCGKPRGILLVKVTPFKSVVCFAQSINSTHSRARSLFHKCFIRQGISLENAETALKVKQLLEALIKESRGEQTLVDGQNWKKTQ